MHLATAQPPARFADLVHQCGEDLPLDRATALLAAEEDPAADPELMLRELDRLAQGIGIRPGTSVYEMVARLNHRLFVEEGFRGDEEEYDHPRNSMLHSVLARRQGLPILLSVVMIEVARRAGAALVGVGFPGHFLVTPLHADPPFYLDPFNQGAALRDVQLRARLQRHSQGRVFEAEDWARFVAPVCNRAILVRMNNNLKSSWVQRRQPAAALRAVERLLVLNPTDADEQRDRGILLAELGRWEQAVEALDRWMIAHPCAADAARIQHLLSQITRR